jgi:4-diphosphocytidyl-2-C-methyl-D-erythritol kinase
MSSHNSLKVLSPAKINLMLRITGQRQDGYHILQTYFQLLNWGDSIQFTPLKDDKIIISGDFKDLDLENNLIYKALELLRPYKKVETGIQIEVDKNIPQGSGLGGGSSNAATTLLMMNDLWNCQLSNQHLQELGLKLGADVPIFVFNKSALAEGVGENLTAFKVNPHYYVLIFPPIAIATADVFQQKNLKRNDSKLSDIELLNDKTYWSNSCLPVVLQNFPEVNSIYMVANKLAPTHMSGTGSTLFSAFKNQQEAQSFIKQCPKQWNLQLCKSK